MSAQPDHDRDDRPSTAQPAPLGGTGPIVQQLVIDDLDERGWTQLATDARERWEFGRRKYGNDGLRAHDGRVTLADAYEECLGLVMYLRQGIAEEVDCVSEYGVALVLAHALRAELNAHPATAPASGTATAGPICVYGRPPSPHRHCRGGLNCACVGPDV